jgi:hypothetical protein
MGLFQYNRLVFGITSAPAIWQRTMDQILEGTSGISCILDDMIVMGKSDAEHMANLEEVLRRLHHHGLGANKSKYEFFKEKITFCGHDINSEGLHKTTDSCNAECPSPPECCRGTLLPGIGELLPQIPAKPCHNPASIEPNAGK